MTGTQAARLWMLLQTEHALGLESVPWKLRTSTRSLPPASPIPATPARPPATIRRTAPATPAAQPPRTLTEPVHPVKSLKSPVSGSMAGPVIPVEKRQGVLDPLIAQVQACRKCVLSQQRQNAVFGEGALDAKLMFIGEGPGETEDNTGRPFVGRAGQLLTKMIGAMGLTREEVYIANVVKCRPPGNRTPSPDEVETCTPYLVKQIEAIRPLVIVTLGLPATQYMLATDRPMRELRGTWQQWRGIKVMPTYHPSYVLRSYTPEVRATVWSDLQKVMAELGLPLKGKANP